MTIEELKRALVEVKYLCRNLPCARCPFHKMDESHVPYCPMYEDEDGTTVAFPANWEIDGWEEGSNGTQT